MLRWLRLLSQGGTAIQLKADVNAFIVHWSYEVNLSLLASGWTDGKTQFLKGVWF